MVRIMAMCAEEMVLGELLQEADAPLFRSRLFKYGHAQLTAPKKWTLSQSQVA